jgi:hypothetical protein
MLREVVRKIDLVLRFIYVALVPALLALLAQFMSVTGLVVTTGLATGIALAGTERWRQRVGHIRFVGKFLGNFARLGEYYATTPPKLLIYYIVWLIASKARREFLLYRRISAIVLETVYRRDEAHGFYIVRVDRTFAIFAKFQRTKPPYAWRAVTLALPPRAGLPPAHHLVDDPAQLPPLLREALTL